MTNLVRILKGVCKDPRTAESVRILRRGCEQRTTIFSQITNSEPSELFEHCERRIVRTVRTTNNANSSRCANNEQNMRIQNSSFFLARFLEFKKLKILYQIWLSYIGDFKNCHTKHLFVGGYQRRRNRKNIEKNAISHTCLVTSSMTSTL